MNTERDNYSEVNELFWQRLTAFNKDIAGGLHPILQYLPHTSSFERQDSSSVHRHCYRKFHQSKFYHQ